MGNLVVQENCSDSSHWTAMAYLVDSIGPRRYSCTLFVKVFRSFLDTQAGVLVSKGKPNPLWWSSLAQASFVGCCNVVTGTLAQEPPRGSNVGYESKTKRSATQFPDRCVFFFSVSLGWDLVRLSLLPCVFALGPRFWCLFVYLLLLDFRARTRRSRDKSRTP